MENNNEKSPFEKYCEELDKGFGIVVSTQAGMDLQERNDFLPLMNHEQRCLAIPYPIGIFKDHTIFVDPYKTFNDMTYQKFPIAEYDKFGTYKAFEENYGLHFSDDEDIDVIINTIQEKWGIGISIDATEKEHLEKCGIDVAEHVIMAARNEYILKLYRQLIKESNEPIMNKLTE